MKPYARDLSQPIEREMAAASIAMATTAALFNPFDTVKVKMQTQNQLCSSRSGALYGSSWQCARRAVLEDGLLRGLWLPGLAASMLRDCINGGVRMGCYAPLLRHLHAKLPWERPAGRETPALATRVVAGLGTGALGAALANPTDVVKCRLQAEAGTVRNEVYVTGLAAGRAPSPGTWTALRLLLLEEGLRHGVFRGLGANCARAAGITATQMTTYDVCKLELARFSAEALQHESVRIALSSFASGLASATVIAPVDLIRSRVMSDHADAPMYRNSVDCVVKTIRTEGLTALYKGWLPAYLRLGPVFFVALPFLEFLRTHVMGLPPL